MHAFFGRSPPEPAGGAIAAFSIDCGRMKREKGGERRNVNGKKTRNGKRIEKRVIVSVEHDCALAIACWTVDVGLINSDARHR